MPSLIVFPVCHSSLPYPPPPALHTPARYWASLARGVLPPSLTAPSTHSRPADRPQTLSSATHPSCPAHVPPRLCMYACTCQTDRHTARQPDGGRPTDTHDKSHGMEHGPDATLRTWVHLQIVPFVVSLLRPPSSRPCRNSPVPSSRRSFTGHTMRERNLDHPVPSLTPSALFASRDTTLAPCQTP